MNEHGPRFWELFCAVFDALPRQGPGNRASAGRALALCRDLLRSGGYLAFTEAVWRRADPPPDARPHAAWPACIVRAS